MLYGVVFVGDMDMVMPWRHILMLYEVVLEELPPLEGFVLMMDLIGDLKR
jgi:hypothetical protein